jgi:Ubiquitin-2 like Rad60 SUMO-like
LSGPLQIFVKLFTGKTLTIDVEQTTTMSKVVEEVMQREKVETDEKKSYRLWLGDSLLKPQSTVKSAGVAGLDQRAFNTVAQVSSVLCSCELKH